jgi:hypothetical protein
MFYQIPRALYKATDASAERGPGRKHIGRAMGVRPNLFDRAPCPD